MILQSKKIKKYIVCFLIMSIVCMFIINKISSNKIVINIGYQSITAQTWGAIIIKEKKLFEKKLKEKYPNNNYEINWYDELSGSIINNNMLAHKYQIGYMGDMPAIINLYNNDLYSNYASRIIACDGKGVNGVNQSILVKKDSKIKSISDLEGKKISVPIGSSAHKMLLSFLVEYNLLNKVEILHQDIPTACNMVYTEKVDAVAAWEPYPVLMYNSDKMRKIYDGVDTKTDYLSAIVVDKNWEAENSDLVKIYEECIAESHEFIKNNFDESVSIISNSTGYDIKIIEEVMKNIVWDMSIEFKDRNTFYTDYEFLIQTKQIKEFPIEKYL